MVFNSLWSFIIRFFILSSVISTANVHAETLLFYDDFWPFSYTEKAQTKGLYFDIVTTVFKNMETEYKVETYPFKRALIMAMEGKGVVVGVFKTDERSLKLEFSKPFYREESVLFVNKKNTFPFSVISDLKGKQVGVKLGWSYGEEFDRAKERKLFTTTVGSPKQIYNLLDLGRLDAVVDNKLSGIGTINDLSLNQSIEALPQYLVLGGIYIAVKRGTNTELIKKFNHHVSRIRDNGEYEKILAKYY
mgnify:CR=1 FL=1